MGSLLYIFFSHDARVFASNGKRSLQEGDKMIRMVHGGAMHAVLGITSHLDTAVLLDDPCSHFWWLDKVLFNYYPWSHGREYNKQLQKEYTRRPGQQFQFVDLVFSLILSPASLPLLLEDFTTGALFINNNIHMNALCLYWSGMKSSPPIENKIPASLVLSACNTPFFSSRFLRFPFSVSSCFPWWRTFGFPFSSFF